LSLHETPRRELHRSTFFFHHFLSKRLGVAEDSAYSSISCLYGIDSRRYPALSLEQHFRNCSLMTDKTFLVRLKQVLHSHLVIAANAEIHGEHLVFLRADGSLAALFALEVVESWSEVDLAGVRDRWTERYSCDRLDSGDKRLSSTRPEFILPMERLPRRHVPRFLYLCSVFPASLGNGGQRVGNQRQPFGVFVHFTPATYVSVPRQKKKDRSMERTGPISSCGNDALVGVDMHNRTGRHQGVQSAVALANDATLESRRRDPIICRKNSGMIRRPNSTGRIRNGKFEEVRGVGTIWKNGA
jgi:hypothetical protein